MCDEYVAVRRDAVEWLKKHYPALCEKSGLCERIAGRLYTCTTLLPLVDLRVKQGLLVEAPNVGEQ